MRIDGFVFNRRNCGGRLDSRQEHQLSPTENENQARENHESAKEKKQSKRAERVRKRPIRRMFSLQTIL